MIYIHAENLGLKIDFADTVDINLVTAEHFSWKFSLSTRDKTDDVSKVVIPMPDEMNTKLMENYFASEFYSNMDYPLRGLVKEDTSFVAWLKEEFYLAVEHITHHRKEHLVTWTHYAEFAEQVETGYLDDVEKDILVLIDKQGFPKVEA